ncbi:MAG TPA: enoyl-CoA hydratase/isomerase family protein [Tepidiformaceae bacterium]|nr:enoyl-CoA hydratase/isomerase family protein [Tepidiformaceae bacterium]
MDTLLVERDTELQGLVTVTLNRPEKLNAISYAMHRELQAACGELAIDHEARVVILTGAGRAFSAGADLGGQPREPGASPVRGPGRARSPLEERVRAQMGPRTCDALEKLPQVTIGAVNGLAIGGAVVLLSCLDIRLAGASAWFSIPEVDLRIPLTWNALPRLMRELGPARTKELVMTCDRFSADDALRWGFVNHVVADSEVASRARELAAKLLAKDAVAIAATKSTTNALAEALVPSYVTHADPDYLILSRLLGESAQS